MCSSRSPSFPVKFDEKHRERQRPKLRADLLDFVNHIERQGLDYPKPLQLVCTARELEDIIRVSSVFYRKAKYVYDQRAQLLTVYMADIFHDHIVGVTFEEWKKQAYICIATHGLAHLELPDLTPATNTILKYTAMDSNGEVLKQRIPDMAFWPEERSWPSWTGEVSHTQSKRHLPGIAEDVIGGTKGAVRAVFTLNCDDMAKPTVQIWRQKKVRGTWIVKPVIAPEDEDVRLPTGIPYADKKVTMYLSDFFPEHIPRNSNDDHAVHVSYHRLSQIVYRARHLHSKYEATLEATHCPEATRQPHERFEKRQLTPEPEETRAERARERRRARSIERRLAREDPEWNPRRR